MLTEHDVRALLDLVNRAIEQIDHGNPEQARGTLEEVAYRLQAQTRLRTCDNLRACDYAEGQFIDDGR